MILTRFGYFWGEADAAAMRRIFDWRDGRELIRALARMQRIQGLAVSAIKIVKFDELKKQYELDMTLHNSAEAEEHAAAFGASDEPVCWIISGYSSGYASWALGEKIYFIEDKCLGAGDRICHATGKDAASWGEKLKPFMKFFRSDDIHGKILRLTEELKRKNRELQNQKKLVANAGIAFQTSPMVEIRSPAFAQTAELAARVAKYDATVLISGESGSGKEVIARYIHSASERAAKPFFPINCGALPDSLLEGELFGYRAGAFTGATKDRSGLLEEAGAGSVFLDEIGDISPALQVKLLRVLQEKEILRLGENAPRKIAARIIAATNKNLKEEIAAGKFREDLYFRLAVVEIEVPPLRERPEDILELARHFVRKCASKHKIRNLRLDASCARLLLQYKWPGNVRELENAIERASIFANDGLIMPENFPEAVVQPETDLFRGEPDSFAKLAEIEARHIGIILEKTGGNKSKAAKLLGISPATLWRKTRRTLKNQ